jgi:hypothetical protein
MLRIFVRITGLLCAVRMKSAHNTRYGWLSISSARPTLISFKLERTPMLFLVIRVWQEGHETSTLHCHRQLALMFCATAHAFARQDFFVVGDELLNRVGIFVIDISNIVRAEIAKAILRRELFTFFCTLHM